MHLFQRLMLPVVIHLVCILQYALLPSVTVAICFLLCHTISAVTASDDVIKYRGGSILIHFLYWIHAVFTNYLCFHQMAIRELICIIIFVFVTVYAPKVLFIVWNL